MSDIVTQADRDAAAAYIEQSYGKAGPRLAHAVLAGTAFPKLVEAFALHRAATLAKAVPTNLGSEGVS